MKEEKEIIEAEEQIQLEKEPVAYDTREYPVEVLIDKYEKDEFIIPKYQREFVWKRDIIKMSKFIESIILDLPIPYLFFADMIETGKLEIVDGSQRIRTLTEFKNNKFKLTGLVLLYKLNGFTFKDLQESRQRRFLRKTLRSIELTEKASANIRRELFSRFNTKPFDLKPMEIRKGIYDDSDFYRFIENLTTNQLFFKMIPISDKKKERGESQELILRYFAYVERYQNFDHSVEDFIDDYIKFKHDTTFEKEKMAEEFYDMLSFVDKNFQFGFRKANNHNTVPRVRFEAISVGVTLALRINPNLIPTDTNVWLSSDEFKKHTTSDASNSKKKVAERIEFVRDKLLGII